jgi:hypothetical protein
MSDSYQATYDAVRSRISNGDVGKAIHDVAWQHFDISHTVTMIDHISAEISTVAAEMARPSVLFKPKLYIDGNMWCALLGDDLQSGIAAFATSPDEAMGNFDAAFKASIPCKESEAPVRLSTGIGGLRW